MKARLAAFGAAFVGALAGCALTPPVDAPPALMAGAPAGEEDRVVVVAVDNPRAELPHVAGATPGLYARGPRYVAGRDARAVLAAVAREHGLEPLAEWPIDLLSVHCATLRLPAGRARGAALAALQRDPRVRLAQPLQRFDTLAAPPAAAMPRYDDPYLPLQRGLQQLGVLQAHRCALGRGARIAVVDTGLDTTHPDLAGARVESANFVDTDAPRFRRDVHGTEVAGLIAARPGNARGIVGIAPESQVFVAKACWERADGPAACNSFTLARALAASIERGAQVINLSLAGPADELLTRLVQAALARGTVVVGARAPQGPPGAFPAGIDGVIGVGDEGAADGLAMPARDVLTLTPWGRYDFASGSSLAAAQVSGMAALMLERRPGLRAADVQRALQLSVPPGGSRRPDACRALAAVDPACTCAD